MTERRTRPDAARPDGARAAATRAAALSTTGVAITAIAALAIGGVLSTASHAQAIPLPRPAPKARDAAQQAEPALPRTAQPVQAVPQGSAQGSAQRAQGSAQVPVPVIPDPRNRAQPSAGVFDANQRALAAKVSSYLSSLATLSGNFVQVGPDGSRTKGDFYIQKPGKVRFEYADPSPIAIVADGSSVVVRDRKLATQDLYPLSQTPLRFLLSDRIDLMRDTNLISVTADDLYISVVIEEKNPLIGTSRLMLMLGAKDNQLKQWTVTDPQGYDTTVAVYNLDSSKRLDPAMFRIEVNSDSAGGFGDR